MIPRAITFFVLIYLLSVVCAVAQTSGAIYGFGGIGAWTPGTTMTFHGGFGGEKRVFKGLSAGAELGFLAPVKAFSEGIGLLSINGTYHFRESGPQPFVTAGYTLAFREGSANLFNLGGGVDLPWSDTKAIRVEFRDHIWNDDYEDSHILDFRVAVLFKF